VRLLADYRRLHADGHFTGDSILPHVDVIVDLVRRLDLATILDFGCGKAGPWSSDVRLRKLRKRRRVRLFDPACPPHDEPLGAERFDLVICTDVLEHVPEEELDGVLDAIFSRALRAVLLHVSTRKSNKLLPLTRRDCHVTVRPEAWWRKRVWLRMRPELKLLLTLEG
jgi:hypothetical protein